VFNLAKYIVTGGAGFIGSHVVEELLKLGESVKVIDNLVTGKLENIAPFMDKITFIEGSITDLALLEKEFEGADFIIHLAALPSVPRSLKKPALADNYNINGTVCVFEAARKKKIKVIYATSSSVYGIPKTLPNVETQPVNPISFYALQKQTCEKYAALFHELYGCDFVGLRLFNVFGPRQDPNSEYAAVIPKFIKLMKQGKKPVILGDGETSRDFTYVKNVVSGFLLACKASNTGGKIYNIATGSRITLNQIVSMINNEFGTNIAPEHENERIGDIKHSFANVEKAKTEIGYIPLFSFESGLKETIKSVVEDMAQEKK
jgi:nucleoside-diphosphate-sugar epimerase